LLYGVWRLIAAAGLVVFSATATLMFGALLNRVADPFTLMNIFHILYAVAIVLLALSGVIGLLAGLALLSGARAGRMLAIFAAMLSLSGIPVGTTLGIYTLIVLLPWNGHLSDSAAEAAPLQPLNRRPLST
jgi:hypothetical protein